MAKYTFNDQRHNKNVDLKATSLDVARRHAIRIMEDDGISKYGSTGTVSRDGTRVGIIKFITPWAPPSWIALRRSEYKNFYIGISEYVLNKDGSLGEKTKVIVNNRM